MITIPAMITSMEIISLTSMKVNLNKRSEKHCRRLVVKNLRHKHLIITRLLIVAIVIKVVMIIRQKSNNKSEFNNCISTEREIDGRFLGIVGLSLKK